MIRHLHCMWGRLNLVSRLMVVVALSFAVAVLAVLFSTASHFANDVRLELSSDLQRELDLLGVAVAPSVLAHDQERLQDTLEKFCSGPLVIKVGFRDVSDSVGFSRETPAILAAPEWFARWCGVNPVSGTRPLLVAGVHPGHLSMEISPVPAINKAWELAQWQMLILVVVLGLAFSGMWAVLRKGLRPLQELSDGALTLGRGNLSFRLESKGSPELRTFIDGFNHMAESVEQMVKVAQVHNLALSHSEENLRVTLQSIGDAVIATDAEGRVTMMNSVAENLTGWPLADALGQKVSRVFHIISEESRLEVESPVNLVLREGSIVGLANHTLLVARDGTERPIADSGAPIRVSSETGILGVVLVFRDQTEEHRRAYALRESQQLYASLAEASPTGIFRTDAEGRLIYANTFLRNIYRGTLLLNSVEWSNEVVVHPEDHSRVWGIWFDAIRNRSAFQSLHRVNRPDGSTMWSSMRAAPLLDAQGRAIGYVGTVLDVTAEQENALKVDRLSRLYATLSGINNLIVHCKDTSILFSDICRVAYQHGGYAGVWLVLADWESRTASLGGFSPPAAECVRPFVEGLKLEADDPSASSMTCRTLLRGERQVSNDYLVELNSSHFLKHVVALGGNSALTVPIKLGEQTVAALVFLSKEKNYFTEDMIALADETGRDVSFALANFERERQRRDTEQKLHDNEQRLRLALRASRQGSYEVDLIRNRILIDGVYAEMLGLKPESSEMSSADYLALRNKTSYLSSVTVTGATGQDSEFLIQEEEHTTTDGIKRWLRWSGAVMEWAADGEPTRILGTVSDITERHALEDHLRVTAIMFDNSKDSIIIADEHVRIVAVNRAFTTITGLGEEEVIGKNPRMFKSGYHDREFYSAMWRQILDVGFWQGELWNRRKSGELYPSLATISIVRRPDGQPTHFLCLSTDITKQKEFEERITKLAYHDSLTNLPNRTLLRDRVEQYLSLAQRAEETFAMLFVDLDHFKNINDSLGHAIGDRLLMEVAQRMHLVVRDMDTVGRLGGDEFLLVLPGADADAAAHVAQKLLAQISKPILIGSQTLTVTPSIGISLYPKDGQSFGDLMKSADTAMYKAKENGRNAYYFASHEMNHAVFQRMVLESGLRRAIDGNEFLLFYQPQYQISGACMVGAEALIRWQQPELGFVSPGEFIPVAEDSGLIEPIGAWVLGEACRQIKDWQDKGVPVVRVGINISTRQFAARNLLKEIDHALEKSGLSGEFLEVEITESLLAWDMNYILSVLKALKDRGMRISVDDFGTGYSSLSYLKRFPIDRLKIDQSFVRDLVEDQDDRAIAAAIVTLGHSLGMKVIAEGVETTDQLQILQDIGCDEMQGFLLARPMLSVDMADLMLKEAAG